MSRPVKIKGYKGIAVKPGEWGAYEGAGPGGICDDCGHFAGSHVSEFACDFPPESRLGANKGKQCECLGFAWAGYRYPTGKAAHSKDAPYL